MGEMRRRKAIPLAFNMSFGLIPVILCMLLSEFILDEHALYISSLVGLIYSFGSYYLSRKRIYNLYIYRNTYFAFSNDITFYANVSMGNVAFHIGSNDVYHECYFIFRAKHNTQNIQSKKMSGM